MKLRLSVICALLAISSALPAVAAGAKCITVESGSGSSCQAIIDTANPIILEMGKQSMPWRWINSMEKQGNAVKWKAKPGRTYQVWDCGDYALEQLALVRNELKSSKAAPSRPAEAILSELKYVRKLRAAKDSEQLRLAETRLSNALIAILNIKINVNAGVDQKLWPAFSLPIGASFTCGAAGVKAQLASISKPDNWQVVSPLKTMWTRIIPGKQVGSQMQVRVSNQAVFYNGNYPIIAWYNVDYKGIKFRASNTAEAQVVSAFDKTVTIDTISDTQIDLIVHLTSLLPIKNVKTELDLPDGWKGTTPNSTFDINMTKDVTYRITRPAGEKPALKIVGAIFRVGDYATSKRLLTDHTLSLSGSSSVAGLKMVQAAGEHVETGSMGERRCRIMPETGHMYFDISDNFPPAGETYVTLECANTGAGAMAIEYYDASGNLCHTPSQAIDTNSTWQKFTFLLTNARFNGSFPESSDIKVTYKGGQLGVGVISISKFKTVVPVSGMAPVSSTSG